MHADELDIDEALVAPAGRGAVPAVGAAAGDPGRLRRYGQRRVPAGRRHGRTAASAPRRGPPGREGTPLAAGLGPAPPLAVPTPLAKSEPGAGYALPWGVCDWLDGENAYDAPLTELRGAAEELGRFVAALWTRWTARRPSEATR